MIGQSAVLFSLSGHKGVGDENADSVLQSLSMSGCLHVDSKLNNDWPHNLSCNKKGSRVRTRACSAAITKLFHLTNNSARDAPSTPKYLAIFLIFILISFLSFSSQGINHDKFLEASTSLNRLAS